MFRPPALDQYKLAFILGDVVKLSPVFAIKAKTLQAEDLLRFAFSITTTTRAADNAVHFPFRFKTSFFSRRKELATNCVYVFRQVAAANVVAQLWTHIGKLATGTEQWVKALARIRNLCATVSRHGEIPDALKPFAIHGTPMYAEALLSITLATRSHVVPSC